MYICITTLNENFNENRSVVTKERALKKNINTQQEIVQAENDYKLKLLLKRI